MSDYAESGKAPASLSSNDATSITWEEPAPVDNHHRPPRTLPSGCGAVRTNLPLDHNQPTALRLVVVSTAVSTSIFLHDCIMKGIISLLLLQPL
ncbi:hypothetical protein CGRA01v4_01818 [Colletotrichum graminicola]|nr:hypothetical protein CGRA01v4_01818 [Colletotrichum graminicola]